MCVILYEMLSQPALGSLQRCRPAEPSPQSQVHFRKVSVGMECGLRNEADNKL